MGFKFRTDLVKHWYGYSISLLEKVIPMSQSKAFLMEYNNFKLRIRDDALFRDPKIRIDSYLNGSPRISKVCRIFLSVRATRWRSCNWNRRPNFNADIGFAYSGHSLRRLRFTVCAETVRFSQPGWRRHRSPSRFGTRRIKLKSSPAKPENGSRPYCLSSSIRSSSKRISPEEYLP